MGIFVTPGRLILKVVLNFVFHIFETFWTKCKHISLEPNIRSLGRKQTLTLNKMALWLLFLQKVQGEEWFRTHWMRMSRVDWSVRVVKNSVDSFCNVVRFERTRNDDSRTLHVLDEVLWVACMLVHVVQFWRILIIIKLQRLKSTIAGACIIQLLQELELEPAFLKIKRTGRVSNWIINTVIVIGTGRLATSI